MNLSIEKKDKVLVAHVQEIQVGADIADEFRARVQAELPEEGAQLAMDLSHVEFMDSSGLGVLVSLLKSVRPSGDVVLYGMKPSVAEILRLTHLDSVFTCEEQEAQAVAHFSDA